MKIATYNVNGVNGRLPVLLRWLQEFEPDIVCLQELKAPDEKFPQQAIEEAGYHAVWHGQKSWNGVAILSKNTKPKVRRRSLPGNEEDLQSRYLEVEIGNLIVAGLYLPNGNPYPGPKFDYKIEWFERLNAHAEMLISLEKPVIIAGDFNVMPTEMDVYKPEKWINDALFRVEIRQAYADLLAQGWTDSIRTLYPDEDVYTFWDYFRQAFQRNAGLRIDHILVSNDLKKLLKDGGVDKEVRGWEKSSDHAPVWVEIKL